MAQANVLLEKHFIGVRAEEIIHHGSPLSPLLRGGNHSHASFWSALTFRGQGDLTLLYCRCLAPL